MRFWHSLQSGRDTGSRHADTARNKPPAPRRGAEGLHDPRGGALLSLALIVDALALFGLAHRVYASMVGDQDPDGPGRDAAREVVELIRLESALATPVLLACYARIVRRALNVTADLLPA